MAELTQAQLEDKISDIDTAIATIVTGLSSDSTAAGYVDYEMGDKAVSASQRLKQLQELRAMYQDLLDKVPKEIVRVHSYDIGVDGTDNSDFEGDQ